MKAFVTGSRAYGRPRPDSDIDLVVLVSSYDLERLRAQADPDPKMGKGTDSDPGTPGQEEHPTASLRFGKLNLICVTDPIAYGVWLKGTEELRKRPDDVDRDEAVAFFRALREKHGLGGT